MNSEFECGVRDPEVRNAEFGVRNGTADLVECDGMSTSEQPKPPVTGATRAQAATSPATKPAAKPAAVPQATPSVASALGDAAKSVVTSAIFEKRPYLKFAFSNPSTTSRCWGAHWRRPG